MFQLSYSFQSSLLTILFCIYCSSFNSLIRLNRHFLLFYSVYIVHVSTLLFASIVTAYYFILYILFMFQLSYRFNRHCLLFYSVYIVHVPTLLFALIDTA